MPKMLKTAGVEEKELDQLAGVLGLFTWRSVIKRCLLFKHAGLTKTAPLPAFYHRVEKGK